MLEDLYPDGVKRWTDALYMSMWLVKYDCATVLSTTLRRDNKVIMDFKYTATEIFCSMFTSETVSASAVIYPSNIKFLKIFFIAVKNNSLTLFMCTALVYTLWSRNKRMFAK